ncbi:uncharacterized protein LOC106088126 [Stomoxys calcitrans]|uniref:uncharacterized protein LOC106088126 n=1 Tax=Stomoxys calcitrans TaxID=35570 RepID=UPI0027E2F602|nr:uncharacterized protein LOC106088126 [Stomoxys calcitrans]
MSQFCSVTIFLIVLGFSDASKVGLCEVCLDSNNAACRNENTFSICYDGKITSTITPCPPNSVCTTDRQICRLTAQGFTPICYEENCNNCNNGALFTCLTQTTFGICSGHAILEMHCPEGRVCNIHSQELCVPYETNQPSCLSVFTTPKPTTTESSSTTEFTTTSSSTTLPPPLDANEFCAGIGIAGYFKTNDPTCKEFAYCYILSGQYLGLYFNCDGYYNPETTKCQKHPPAGCEETL